MAWSTPLTAVANTSLTAAQWNASVRDNLNETAPAKFTAANEIFVASGLNAGAALSSQSYTPTWAKVSGAAPTQGNGTLLGFYLKVGDACHFSINFTWGSTTTATDGGFWTFALPVTASPTAGTPAIVSCLLADVTGNYYSGYGVVEAGASAVTRTRFHGTASGASLENTSPVAMASGDVLYYTGWYWI